MKVTIRDPEVFGAIRISSVLAFLRSRGWVLSEEKESYSLWTKLLEGAGGSVEVLLPASSSLGDFARRMGEIVQVISAVENRSEIEVLGDLSVGSADVVRIAVKDPSTEEGTISLTRGLALVDGARNIMVAAACSTLQPRPIYGPRKPDRALQMADGLRLGQTERGSYVVTVVSRVPPLLTSHESGDLFPETLEEPFERQVTTLLNRALTATKRATRTALHSGRFDDFMGGVPDGISANLCDALVQISDGVTLVDLDFDWSPSRPIPAGVQRLIQIEADEVDVIREASRIFRDSSPRPDFDLHGVVVRLARAEGAESGTATVLALVDEQHRQIQIELVGEAYDVAILAHRDEQPIRVTGTLAKDGRSWALVQPRDFRIS